MKKEFLKFCLVGLLNTGIDFGVLNLLIAVLGVTSGNYPFLKSTSFIFAATNSFLWNKFWVFKDNSQIRKKDIFYFFSVSLTGLLINTLVAGAFFWLIFNNFPYLDIKLTANIGALAGVAAIVIWDFVGYKYIVFNQNR